MRIITAFLINLLVFSSLALAQDGRQLTQEKGAVSKDKRIALVIGNGGYKFVGPLGNPVNDATDIAAALETLGFEVIKGTDTNLVQMKQKIREFGEKLAQQKGVGLFYYAGHGVEMRGRNFLVPIDANIAHEVDTEDNAVELNMVLRQMDAAKNGFNIVILDACRNNPFSRGWNRSGDTGGLAQTNAPTGTYIAFAAAPGSTASDGKGTRNGIFTGALLKILKRPNLKLEEVFKATREEVMTLTANEQVPWDSSSIKGDFYFSVSTPLQKPPDPQTNSTAVVPRPTPLPTPTPVAVTLNLDGEGALWQYVTGRDTQSVYESYLVEYPSGKYVADAKNKIEKFKQAELVRLKDLERAKWREAQSMDSKDAYNVYLAAYPNGEFVAEARSGIKTLESRDERAKWNAAQSSDTKDAYNDYLKAYPKGEFVANARSGIHTLETKEDQAKWDEVQILNRKTAFQSYLSAYPNGKYTASARQRIGEFENSEAITQKEKEKATEKAKWDEAERLKTIEAYDAYLTSYPNGAYASLARLRLSNMGVSRSPVEETDWQEISGRNTRSDYQVYLSKYPDGKYASTAKEKIKWFDEEEARAIRERQRSQDLAALRGKITIATGDVDLKTWGEVFDRGEEVVFKIKYYYDGGVLYGSSDPSQNLKNGRLRVRKDLISFEALEGGPSFSVPSGKFLIITNEQPLRLRLRVGIKKGNKEDYKDYDFFHPSAFAFLTRQSVLGGILNPIVTKYQCDGCDNSIAVLFGFLQAIRQSQQIEPVPPSGKSTSILGKYIRKGKKGDYIQLDTDGTFFLRQNGKDYKGNYRALEDSIIVQVLNSLAETMVIKGNTLVESDGTVWEKQP